MDVKSTKRLHALPMGTRGSWPWVRLPEVPGPGPTGYPVGCVLLVRDPGTLLGAGLSDSGSVALPLYPLVIPRPN